MAYGNFSREAPIDLGDCTDYDEERVGAIRTSVETILSGFTRTFGYREYREKAYQNYLVWQVTRGRFDESAMAKLQKVVPQSTWAAEPGGIQIRVPLDDPNYVPDTTVASIVASVPGAKTAIAAVKPRNLTPAYAGLLFIVVLGILHWVQTHLM